MFIQEVILIVSIRIKRMSFETAVKTIDFLAAHSLNCNEVSIGFYGGEPLLEIELIKKAVSYAKEVFGEKKGKL